MTQCPRFLSALLLMASPLLQAEPAATQEDHRQLVEMPPQAQRLMQADMLDHMAALNQIIGLLAAGDLEQAGEVAETRMGRSSMGKHRGTGMGPGRFMPDAMRRIGWGMHDAASEFAEVAKQGDAQAAWRSLQNITNSCVACHYSYRTQ